MEAAVWISLAFLVLVVLGSGTYVVVRGWRVWRTFRAFSRTIDDSVASVLSRAAKAEERALGLTDGATRLSTGTARIHASLERLAVLRAAAGEASAVLAALRGSVPRK
jgi:hypothetical protein